ncbi:Kelch repeat-containing protein [Sorangium sp. So ce341]|uniref:Kelch repeat-containing protein n=1 Tax=Sorangium sp. So ce341 TaxID=3133302 RepID=UPI003F63FA36
MRSMSRLGAAAFSALILLRAGAVWAASAPSWESLPPMITPRGEHTATVLQDGRVLVVGGYPELDAFYYTNSEAMSLRQVEIYDPATKTWSPAAPLGRGRAGHAAILLPNGHVLVAGGRQASEQTEGTELSSAETYDPASNTWTAAGNLPLPHPDPSMMLLNGKPVLVGLAWNSRAILDMFHTAVYDPETRNWTELPFCDGASRVYPVGATLLHDGRVMAVGGGCSVYDPESRLWTWETGAVLSTIEYTYPGAVTLPGGGVLVVGGTTNGPDPEVHAFAQVYLPEHRRWEPTSGPYAPATTPCRPTGSASIMGLRTSLLPSGRVLLTGGVQPCWARESDGIIIPFHATMSIFDESTLAWSPLELEPPVTMARAHHSATPLRDGSVLIAGGYVDVGGATTSALLFRERSQLGAGCDTDSDCNSGFCADSVCCDAACAGPCDACAAAAGASQDGVCTPVTGVACDDADACIAGGVCEAGACVGGGAAPDGTPCSDGDVCSTASVCEAGACVGSSVAECLPADDCHEAPACDPEAGCAASGPAKPDGAPCDVEATEDGWHETGRTNTGLGFDDPMTTVLPDGTVLAIGRWERSTSPTYVGFWTRYDPSTGAWQPDQEIGGVETPETSTLLPDGTVLVMGVTGSGSTVRRFDPATGAWTSAAPPLAGRSRHTATLLADGRVLAVGGDGRSLYAGGNGVEIYDPAADTWTAAAPMIALRRDHTATLLQDGRVLVAGGSHNRARHSSAEVYDPATDTWTSVGSMGWGRAEHTMTQLADGRVLVVGGVADESVTAAEVFDPASGTWMSAGEMATARMSPGAALLADGRVMVTGESIASNDGALAAEIYDPASGAWALAPALEVMIGRHATARLRDGRVLIAGGHAGNARLGYGYQPIANAWLYVPAQAASRGTCQAGACVPGGDGSGGEGGGGSGEGGGGASGGGGGASAGGGGGGADASGGGGADASGGSASGGGGTGGMATGGHGGDASSGTGGGAVSGSGGDASGGGGAGGMATGGHGGDASGGAGGMATGGHGGDASGGGNASSGGNASTGGAGGEGGTGGAVAGGHGGDAGSGGDATSTTTSATGGGSDAIASTSAGATGAQSSGGGDPPLPSAGGGGGCRMTPGNQGGPDWLLALAALASTRLRRRRARSSRPT